jgi:uncharacterized protein YjbI with pentapeptide repeats
MAICKYPDGFNHHHGHPCTLNDNGSGYCIFHDEAYLNAATAQILLAQFNNLLNQNNQTGTELRCSGFILPSLDLSKKEIKNLANFENAVFKGRTDFGLSTFHQEGNFLNAKFEGEASFVETQFKGKARFGEAVFKGRTDFGLSTFHQEGNFLNAKFEGEASFVKAIFRGKADFGLATFNRNGYFGRTEFLKLSYFWKCSFRENAFFYKTSFSAVDFTDCIFNKVAKFTKCVFTDTADLRAKFRGITFFSGVKLPREVEVIFDGDLSFVSFAETYLGTNVRFGGKTRWSRDYKILDEILLEVTRPQARLCQRLLCSFANDSCVAGESRCNDRGDEDELETILQRLKVMTSGQKEIVYFRLKDILRYRTLEDVISQYSNLRENYEYHQKYDISGNFFVRESELRRTYKSKSIEPAKKHRRWYRVRQWLRKRLCKEQVDPNQFIARKHIAIRVLSFSFLYKWIANYGESYSRPLLIVLGIFIFGWYYFSTSCIDSSSNDCFTTGFYRALSSILPATTPKVENPDIAIKAIAVPLEAVSLIGFRRHFERKFRH